MKRTVLKNLLDEFVPQGVNNNRLHLSNTFYSTPLLYKKINMHKKPKHFFRFIYKVNKKRAPIKILPTVRIRLKPFNQCVNKNATWP